MRHKIARAMRKWADLIDPRINPSIDNDRTTINADRVILTKKGIAEAVAKIAQSMKESA